MKESKHTKKPREKDKEIGREEERKRE